tara:strand:+ start:343 stop:531 length:189 start_codon:yes stop_codon:yes gene_type:complete
MNKNRAEVVRASGVVKRRLSIHCEKNVLKAFKLMCCERETAMSDVLESFITNYVLEGMNEAE